MFKIKVRRTWLQEMNRKRTDRQNNRFAWTFCEKKGKKIIKKKIAH